MRSNMSPRVTSLRTLYKFASSALYKNRIVHLSRRSHELQLHRGFVTTPPKMAEPFKPAKRVAGQQQDVWYDLPLIQLHELARKPAIAKDHQMQNALGDLHE